MIIQKLEEDNQGLINSLIEGVEADRAALPKRVQSRTHVEAIIRETFKILDRAKAGADHKNENDT
ncbi:Putative uncharacterized protein [Moritella viscosa]|uniref:Uncharacterized protein n=2 Tax=Moritella viscosa TaxID=80854 RepID=A0A1L0C8K4_9GAMM|nr:Putative uncharacterized protein [Moritella viscosa]SHO12126.1 Putative uncharacterized protein [Moritella viscosa]SHO16456.1 Putative uncharacterized protein [Moritella viscosa]SHO18302.1 Putative uncharacterized protein [Moritella viscosa]